ncbi:antirepressor protein [Pseudomonas phage vB_PaeM_USP_18]|nr:antirepressor protein [Pseudomonas phage vB_PaeM_USP_18]QLI49492.1 antirepressor protein [Pseudomonas phage vB_PaeM_USP_25]
MSQLQNIGVTMSSVEIAELVGSRHDKVKQSIERLAKRGAIGLPPMGEVRNHLGQLVAEYRIGKRDSYVIVAQLSPEFTARLVDRWQELEAGLVPQSFAQALRLAADQQERIEQQAQALALAQPKVEFVDRYVEGSGLKGFRQVAKLLRANESRFREFLRDRGIMYRLGGEWMPYQQHIDAGRFEVKTGAGENDHVFNQAKFTPKGVAWISDLWQEREVAHG